ncbi:MAG: hypothetical protein QHH75_09560 [Bacillota bacterium]|nr:hypothetical protein [Bacillota bacterium]
MRNLDNDRFQELVLEQLKNLAEGQSQLQLQVTGATSRLDGIEKQLNGLEQDVKRMEIRMENEIIDKIRALYDARSVQEDVNNRIINTLDRIEAKLDVLQMETAHIRRIRRNKGI